MNTKIINIAKTMDNAIEDVNAEYAKTAGGKILDGLIHAGIARGVSYLYLGAVVINTTELTMRAAKTGVKKAVIAIDDFYSTTPAIAVRR